MDIKTKILNHNKDNNLVFNEEEHKYFILENQELSSVTTYLSHFFPFNAKKVAREVAMKNWVTEGEILENWRIARDNGSYIHDLADKYCSGENLKEDELNTISNVIDFFKENSNFNILASEIKIFSKKYNLAGTIDLIVEDKNIKRIYLVDWKTSNKNIDKKQEFSKARGPFSSLPNNKFYSYSAQLSMYSLILKDEYNIDVWDFFVVHLKFDSTFKRLELIDLRYDLEDFFENS